MPDEAGFSVPAYSEPLTTNFDVPWWSFSLDLGLKLIVVLALAYLCLYALKRFTKYSGRAMGATGQITVLEGAALAPNRQLFLVSVAGRVLVLGSTPTQISTLAEITDPEMLAAIQKPDSLGVAPAATFARQFLSLAKGQIETPPEQPQPARADPLRSTSQDRQDRHGERAERVAAREALLDETVEPGVDPRFLADKIAELREISRGFASTEKSTAQRKAPNARPSPARPTPHPQNSYGPTGHYARRQPDPERSNPPPIQPPDFGVFREIRGQDD